MSANNPTEERTAMAEESEVFWSHKHRATGVEVQCQADRACYLSFNWNGAVVWEYIGSAGARNGKSFAQYLRKIADEIERKPKHSSASGEGGK